MTAEEITDIVAALMNDPQQQQYTFSALLPHLNLALQMLEEEFELSNVPSTNETSAIIVVLAAIDSIGGGGGDPALPTDLIEIQQLWSRPTGSANTFLPMTKYEFLPNNLNEQQFQYVQAWSYSDQIIKFIPATGSSQIKINYIKSLFAAITDTDDEIDIINSKTYLEFMTASLASRFIGENPTRADSLESQAIQAMDRTLGISTKGRQSIMTRHRPFRSSHKRRSYAGS